MSAKANDCLGSAATSAGKVPTPLDSLILVKEILQPLTHKEKIRVLRTVAAYFDIPLTIEQASKDIVF